MIKAKTLLSFMTVALFLLAAGCRTAVEVVEEDLSPDQYFQRAIEATDLNNYRLAMDYYKIFLERYPEDLQRSLWARYEIAFLHHKMGDDETAIALFDELVALYEGRPEGVDYPTGPLVLAEKVKSNILAEQEAATGRRRLFRRRENGAENPS